MNGPNWVEGSIPALRRSLGEGGFTRSIDYQALTNECSKCAVNVGLENRLLACSLRRLVSWMPWVKRNLFQKSLRTWFNGTEPKRIYG